MVLQLSLDVHAFRSVREVIGYVDKILQNLEKKAQILEKLYNDTKARAERLMRLEKYFSEILGGDVSSIREIDLMGLKVIVDSRPVDELKVYDEVLSSIKDRIDALRKVRKVIEPLANTLDQGENIQILLETMNGIPIRLLIKMPE